MSHILSDKELIELLHSQFELRNTEVSKLEKITSELEITNQQLVRSEEMKSYFLSHIRNEINNPLAAIIGAASHLLETDDPEIAKQLAQVISNESKDLHFQMENIFAASELEGGSISPAMHQVDIESIMLEVLNNLQKAAQEKEIAIQLNIDTSDQDFFTDEHLLQLASANLIDNAIKFSEPKQSIEINVSFDPEALSLSIVDHGIGIAPEHQSQIFDRFRQLDEGLCKEHAGQGLGLSIIKAIADLLNGSIALESTLGEGSKFTLRIPNNLTGESVGHMGNELFFDEDDDTEAL